MSKKNKPHTNHTDAQERIVYGIHPVEELLAGHEQMINHVYIAKGKTNSALFGLVKQCRKKKLPCNMLPMQKLNAISGTTRHQGAVAACSPRAYLSEADFLDLISLAGHPPCVVCPSSMQDPRNLGSILRSCWAFGADGILLERARSVGLNSTVAKTSAGASEHLAIARPYNLGNTIRELTQRGFAILGAHAHAGDSVRDFDFSVPVCCIVGSEDKGIPPYLKKLCTSLVHIPMQPRFDSLNASVAVAVMLYECYIQRAGQN